MAKRPALAELPYDALHQASIAELAAIGDRRDDLALALDQPGHRLIDRLRGQQVPGGDRVPLADPVTAVLGLVVDRRGPLELQEAHVRGSGESDALCGDPGGADDQRRAGGILEAA